MAVKKLLKPWPRRLLLLRISKFAIAITLALSIIVVGLSIYMNNVGNFIISVEKTERLAISLSENNDFVSNATSILYAKGMTDITNATYANIPDDIDKMGFGLHSDTQNRRYWAYTFALKNTSPIDISYSMTMTINQVYKNVDGALRVMLIRDGERTIYAKRDAQGNPVSYTENPPVGMKVLYDTEPFVDDRLICTTFTPVLKESQTVIYTVVMWLEGFDEDCVDDIKGGAIRITMNFKAS